MSLQKALSIGSDLAASRLLGGLLVRRLNGQQLVGRIVETESYDQSDVASHSYRGRTPRNEVMFGPAGRLYVYFTYGLHYCCNIVVGPDGHGSAVLIRALEPIEGLGQMRQLRGGRADLELCNGPAKVCQAFMIDKQLNGHNLDREPLKLILKEPVPTDQVVVSTRIGISQAKDEPWRFYLKGNRFVSKL